MLKLDEMLEIRGGMNPTVDFKKSLSSNGRRFFIEGLVSWQNNLITKLAIKMKDVSQDEFEDEKKKEREAYLLGSINHDPDLGPISILHSYSQLQQIKCTLAFVEENESFWDIDLYQHLIDLLPEPKFRDIKVVESEDEVPEDLDDIKETIQAIVRCDESTDHTVGKETLSHIFKIYRISQLDIVSPIEEKIFVSELRAGYNPSFLYSYDFKESAISNANAEETEKRIDEIYTSNLNYVSFKQCESLLHLYHGFSNQYEKNGNNAHNYLVALRIIHAFENLQVLVHESVNDIAYEDVIDKLNEGTYQTWVSIEEYAGYYKDKDDSRFPLIDPEDLEEYTAEGDLNAMDYEDFTNFSYKKMSFPAREKFDSFLQNKVNQYAKHLKMPTIDVAQFHEFVARYEKPGF